MENSLTKVSTTTPHTLQKFKLFIPQHASSFSSINLIMKILSQEKISHCVGVLKVLNTLLSYIAFYGVKRRGRNKRVGEISWIMKSWMSFSSIFYLPKTHLLWDESQWEHFSFNGLKQNAYWIKIRLRLPFSN